jgi:hypothetical protein
MDLVQDNISSTGANTGRPDVAGGAFQPHEPRWLMIGFADASPLQARASLLTDLDAWTAS